MKQLSGKTFNFQKIFDNKNFVNIAFFGLLLISLAGFIFVFNTKDLFFNIPIFGTVNDNLVINVEVPEKFRDNLHFFADGKEIPQDKIFDKNTYATYIYDNSDAKNIYFILDNNNIINEINNIVIQLNNFYYFNNQDIKNFERGKNGEYFLPNKNLKYCKSSEYPTDKGFGHKIFIYIMSVFYNSKYYILPLFCFALAVLIYQKNKEKFNFNFSFFKNSAIWWILILGIFLRIHYMVRPYWYDEIYAVFYYCGHNLSLIYGDQGNPPLYYLILKLWMYIGGNSEIWTRTLSCIFSVLTVGAVYYFVKKNVNKSLALISAFWITLNCISIYSAQETRCYALGCLLTVLSSICLFQIIREKRNKDFIIYSVLAVLMANTHYFLILILISNFLYAIFLLDKKSRIKLLLSNIIAALSYLPHFLISGMSGLTDKIFNSFLQNADINTLFKYFSLQTGGYLISLILIILFILILIPKIRNKLVYENKPLTDIMIYCFYTILLLYVTSYLFSLFIKPIISEYYFIYIITFLGIYISCCLFLKFKNKILKVIICGLILLYGFFYFGNYRLVTPRNDHYQLTYDTLFKYAYFNHKNYNNKQTGVFIWWIEDFWDYYADYTKNSEKFIVFKEINNTKKFLKEANVDVIYLRYFNHILSDLNKITDKYYVGIIQSDNKILTIRIIKK